MTELGTGSNVPGIQTTATYDKEKQQFIINTPNLQATKWWIGGAADTATHAVVFARLILEGMDFGPNIFVVQLRDLKDHTLMPGVSIGDCGSKMVRIFPCLFSTVVFLMLLAYVPWT
jgi:acyl-CoA oxidase